MMDRGDGEQGAQHRQVVAAVRRLDDVLYAHAADHSSNAAWGDYVLCTTHFDNNELGQTRGAPKWYGMSEDAAGAVDGWFAAHGYRVSANSVWLGNVEAGANGATWHPDIIDPSHRWQNDGNASMIYIP